MNPAVAYSHSSNNNAEGPAVDAPAPAFPHYPFPFALPPFFPLLPPQAAAAAAGTGTGAGATTSAGQAHPSPYHPLPFPFGLHPYAFPFPVPYPTPAAPAAAAAAPSASSSTAAPLQQHPQEEGVGSLLGFLQHMQRLGSREDLVDFLEEVQRQTTPRKPEADPATGVDAGAAVAQPPAATAGGLGSQGALKRSSTELCAM
eukprot:gene42449-51858_t